MAQEACVKRLQKEYRAICKEPVKQFAARPSPSNLLEWHYVLQGSEGSPYAGGYYYGTIKFPPEYPFKPPGICMITPNGRFAPYKKICLSMSDYHPESWNPMWSVSSILTGLLSFMLEDTPTTGCVVSSTVEKQKLAKCSLDANCKCPTFRKMFPEYVQKYELQQLAQQPHSKVVSSTSPEQGSSSSLSGKDGSSSKKENLETVKPQQKNPTHRRRRRFPTWILILLLSIFVALIVLPLLQLQY